MRKTKDRRKHAESPGIPCGELLPGSADRRKQPERRLENLDATERQLLLSEMPGNTGKKPADD